MDNPATMEELFPYVYEHIRAMAKNQMRSERVDHTLCTTALIHEVYLRLAHDNSVAWKGDSYFYASIFRCMRRILVDHARKYHSLKRGGDWHRDEYREEAAALDGFHTDILDVERALNQLQQRHPRRVQVVEARYFCGLSVEETARYLGISERTVKQDWALSKVWLQGYLDERK